MVNFPLQQVGEVLQRLYDSEINLQLSSFWDTGWDFDLGDSINGFTGASEGVRTWGVASAVDVLAFNAQKQYPESEFAAWYKGLQVEPGQGVEFKNYRGKY